jgi:hypothetical protein
LLAVITLKSNRQAWDNGPSTSVGYENNYSQDEVRAGRSEEVISGSQHDHPTGNHSPNNYLENADTNSLEFRMDTEISEQQQNLRTPTERSVESRNTETDSGFISVRSYSPNDTISMLSVRSAASYQSHSSYLSVISSSSTNSDSSKTGHTKVDLPVIAEE